MVNFKNRKGNMHSNENMNDCFVDTLFGYFILVYKYRHILELKISKYKFEIVYIFRRTTCIASYTHLSSLSFVHLHLLQAFNR